jgi:hypothetical protein
MWIEVLTFHSGNGKRNIAVVGQLFGVGAPIVFQTYFLAALALSHQFIG